MVAMLIEGAMLIFLAITTRNQIFLVAGIISLAPVYPFYLRFIRYGESFAKEVLRSFAVNFEYNPKSFGPTSNMDRPAF